MIKVFLDVKEINDGYVCLCVAYPSSDCTIKAHQEFSLVRETDETLMLEEIEVVAEVSMIDNIPLPMEDLTSHFTPSIESQSAPEIPKLPDECPIAEDYSEKEAIDKAMEINEELVNRTHEWLEHKINQQKGQFNKNNPKGYEQARDTYQKMMKKHAINSLKLSEKL